MALPAAPLQYSYSPLSRAQSVASDRLLLQPLLIRSASSNRRCCRVFATETTSGKQKAQPGEDTRIHWENEDEGWIGGSNSKTRKKLEPEEKKQDLLDENFSELLNSSTDSHYQYNNCKSSDEIRKKKSNAKSQRSVFPCALAQYAILMEKTSHPLKEIAYEAAVGLPIYISLKVLNEFSSIVQDFWFLGVSAQADMEEIKSAYRRLSKEYHPDTTSLPLKVASEKFMQLRDIYDTLSDKEKRRFYDWTLAQETASREAEKMRIKFEDPYIQQLRNFESVPDMVDRLGGKNLELSDQAKSALTFDILIIIFSICCIAYVLIFKEPYY